MGTIPGIAGIDPTRASKARAIYRTFPNEEDVARLTVEAAYAQRRRRQPTQPPNKSDGPDAKKSAQGLRMSVGKIANRAGTVVHDAAFATPDEATILIPAVRKAIRELEMLLRYLEEQAVGSKTLRAEE